MPTIMYLFGLRFYFYSEEHLPIHVHVQNGDGKAKINVETLEVIENKGIIICYEVLYARIYIRTMVLSIHNYEL